MQERGERSIRIECCLSCAVRTRVLRELCIGGVSYYNAQARVNGELNGESSSSCLRLPNGHFTLVIALKTHCGGRPRDSRSFGTMSRSSVVSTMGTASPCFSRTATL